MYYKEQNTNVVFYSLDCFEKNYSCIFIRFILNLNNCIDWSFYSFISIIIEHLSRRHEALTQCGLNSMLGQRCKRWPNIETTLG